MSPRELAAGAGRALASVLLLAGVLGCSDECAAPAEPTNLYFGDLHAHTAYSFDAHGYEVRTTPAEAFAFARGNPVALPPLDAAGAGTRSVAIDRPLDFAAVTDHLEFVAEVRLCVTPGSAAYDGEFCTAFREGGAGAVSSFGVRLSEEEPTRVPELCGADAGVDCDAEAAAVWDELVAAAEAADDPGGTPPFTAFAGYEYTASPAVTNLHRNVIFGGSVVPALPPSYFEQPTPLGLWQELDAACLAAGTGCDVIVVPHNSNWSNGQLYTPSYDPAATIAEQAALAQLRATLEPVSEVFQHKGDMECRNGFDGLMGAPDPLCDFEKLEAGEPDDCGDGTGAGGVIGYGCESRLDYLRNVFKQGQLERSRLGVNPYKFAVIGSTDTHNGTPGNTAEQGFPGHVGVTDDSAQRRLGPGTITHRPRLYNPGGLAAVWAPANTRAAIFDALRRRETYATSGTRIALRFFGGWELPRSLCDGCRLVEEGYARGVPMGGDLPLPPAAAAPRFAVRAEWDPGTPDRPGTKLQRLEIVKGWIDATGAMREAVYLVAGDPANGATVDEGTCARSGPGAARLCGVWTDPDFDPTLAAFYYARAVENPSCRWSTYDCLSLPEGERPDACGPDGLAKTIQERAWSSPIWYEP